MRVLFTTLPGPTLLYFMAPLAWALRIAGHEVRVACEPDFVETVTQAGLTAVPVGVGDEESAGDDEDDDEPETGEVPAPYDAAVSPGSVEWEHMLTGYRGCTTGWHRPMNDVLTADLVDFARRWRPDLVLWEPCAFAGAIAAKACGAAHARVMWCLDVFGVAREHFLRLKAERPAGDHEDPLADWLAEEAARYGFEFTEDMVTGHFTIEQLPPSIRLHAEGLDYLPLRYTPYGGPATVPDWLWAPPERPRVALTLGLSLAVEIDRYAVDVQGVIDAVADLDVELVATVHDSQRHTLTSIPDNVRVVPYVPLHHLAPTCAAVIHHAGAGTLATTTLHGVPQLALPWEFDEPMIADGLVRSGAGLALPATEATGAAVRERLRGLLDEPAFRQGAGRLRDEMLAMPDPHEVVLRLEELAGKHRSAPAGA
ncbi:activator-dependent family glycosyltransferase [Saccharothrix australiensis]|uniref:Glycosyltransferase (Activator-dependent family) n=1 Tax=Saccharothrix australiensis TaxID=2072 RepID=A0A495W4F5_9PSEU|nr:activator-dependent family glycosyltransferase [Saccharothrix australiensis]RKT54688.1 glycosyltransferase (activator-dependent family) [Saccharothrix australiensis]